MENQTYENSQFSIFCPHTVTKYVNARHYFFSFGYIYFFLVLDRLLSRTFSFFITSLWTHVTFLFLAPLSLLAILLFNSAFIWCYLKCVKFITEYCWSFWRVEANVLFFKSFSMMMLYDFVLFESLFVLFKIHFNGRKQKDIIVL